LIHLSYPLRREGVEAERRLGNVILEGWQHRYLLKIPMDTPAKIASQLYQLNIRKAPLIILFMIDPLCGKRQSENHPELWFLNHERARHRSSHVLIGKYPACTSVPARSLTTGGSMCPHDDTRPAFTCDDICAGKSRIHRILKLCRYLLSRSTPCGRNSFDPPIDTGNRATPSYYGFR
jgi:hypothetical protein